MPIEIKELHIKINIEENQQAPTTHSLLQNQKDLAALKKDVIKSCVQQVLEIINEKQER